MKISTFVEMLAPWPGGSSLRKQTYHSGELLRRTSEGEELPDPRYWTAYDHFMTEYEARVQRASYFYGVLERAWRKLASAINRFARRVTSRTQPS